MRLYLFIGSPFALDVDTGVATVTSGRGKGKYREDLQLGHNEDVSWLTGLHKLHFRQWHKRLAGSAFLLTKLTGVQKNTINNTIIR